MAAVPMFDPPKNIQKTSHCPSMERYREMHKQSIEDPEAFWSEIGKEFYFKKPPTPGKFLQYNFDINKGPIFIKWLEGAVTNLCYNAVDRNVKRGLGDSVAFYWEGNDPGDDKKITYKELQREVCKFANVLKTQGLKKGDRVAIYMPMILEILVAMLACARLGIVHSVVFGGFSPESLADRIMDGACRAMIVADGTWRGTKLLNLKNKADGAMEICEQKGHPVECCIVVKHLSPPDDIIDSGCECDTLAKRPYKKLDIRWTEGRDFWWHEEMANISEECEPVWMDAEDPLFMLYTSGSTGKPKGVLHTQAGYMLHCTSTFKYIFDYHINEVYWCSADVGWITGHTCVCYGPLIHGATSVLFEGILSYPDPGRVWAIVEKYKINKFYTAPTAIRSFMKYGEKYVTKYNRDSLTLIGTAGEPINQEAWLWYHRVVGNSKCAIVDTFWQTETGGATLTPMPGATRTKPGSATFPFYGIVPVLLTAEGEVIEGEGEGYLVFKQPWPGIMRTVYGNHERFEETYFKQFPGYYCTGDGARRDEDGYLWVTGRIDDMLNISGRLISTSEVESALTEHPSVAENAVVARPHPIKGECLYCFVTLKEGKTFNEDIVSELKLLVRQKIGPLATPDYVQEAPTLPKTRSGKIMRRLLRKIATGDRDLGDVSTLADEAVIDLLFSLKPKNA